MSRNLLHRTKIDEFKKYLNDNGIVYRDGRGDYQVIQVQIGTNWMVIFDRNEGDHFTVDSRMDHLVKKFIKNTNNDTVTIPCAEHDRLLWLTTPKPIETAPRDEWILVCGNFGWIEAKFNPHFNEFMTQDEFSIQYATHWQPLPASFAEEIEENAKILNGEDND